jgi:cephalosporin-C deacetylase-like acetyl esterase
MKMKLFSLFCALCIACAAGAAEYKFELKSNKNWKLKANEEITFSAVLLSRENAKAPFAPVKGAKISCRLVLDGLQTVAKTFVTADKAFTVSAKRPTPGWIYARFALLDEKGKEAKIKDAKGKMTSVYAGIGALVEPEKLQPGKEEPKDFDAFWKSQRELLNKVPLKAKLTEVKNPRIPKTHILYDVQVDCAGGMPMSGYMSVPRNAKPKSLPAYVSYQGAGVSSSWPGASGKALYMNINAHGIPNGQPAAFYQKLRDNELKGYWHRNRNDREKIYFNGMYLRVMRSLDFIKSRPEWNGKVLIVSGSSQGGGQAIAAAALDPQVTLCVAAVAALSDHAGSYAKRQPGWPRFYDARNKKLDPKIPAATAYYDNVYFARRIKCETWMTTGLFDTTCSPAGVYTVFNNLAAKNKQIDVVPTGNHGGAPARKAYTRINAVISGK